MNARWHVYRGGEKRTPPDEIEQWLSLEGCPPWRRPFRAWDRREDRVEGKLRWDFDEKNDEGAERAKKRAVNYVSSSAETGDSPTELDQVNLALLLRRPLLVRGSPGIGKSSLAYNIAWCLGLGRPFRWEISSTSSLNDGLYTYDAVGHFHEGKEKDIQQYIRLGPLGTALVPARQPACLLVDELDKSSYDLPNDLLHAFEEGAFRIRELEKHELATVRTQDGRDVPVRGGVVRCHHHPVVVITSNDEREFPPAFKRRCVELTLQIPNLDQMRRIVEQWFDNDEGFDQVIDQLEGKPTDSLLQALFLTQRQNADLAAVKRGLLEGRNE